MFDGYSSMIICAISNKNEITKAELTDIIKDQIIKNIIFGNLS